MKKILIIQTASIGDVILATPVLEGLHAAYPSADIDLLIKKGMEGLFKGHPFTGNLIIWDKSEKYRDASRIFSEIRKNKYDLIVNLQRFALTGLLTACSGATTTVGFSKNPFSFLFTKSIPHRIGKGVHEVERNLSLIQPLITANQRAKDFGLPHRPSLYPAPTDEATVAQYKKQSYVTISPASLWYTKQYPVKKWAGLMQSLPPGLMVYLLGSASDTSLCDEIRTLSGRENIVILAGILSLLESAALMRDATMNYTNDSAPMHLASAVNAPTAVIYCSTIPEFGFGPLSVNQWIIQSDKHLTCKPCGIHGRRECPERHFECALTIRPDQFPELI